MSKTHHGVQTEFFRLTKDDSRADHILRRFLSESYDFKSIADYFAGPDPKTSPEDAADAVEAAKRFVSHFAAVVPVR